MRPILLKFTVAFLLIFSLSPGLALAGEVEQRAPFELGMGVGIGNSEYKHTDAAIIPLPVISYEAENYYFRGLKGGLNLYKDSMHEFSVTASYLPQFFRAKESNKWYMRRLDSRYSTAHAGFNYRLSTEEYGMANISATGDFLGISDGILVKGTYGYPFTVGQVTFVPSAGAEWANSKHNDYYYGVSSKESRKSGLKKYKAQDGVSPFIGLDAKWRLENQWSIFVHGQATFLSDEVKDSPMVGEDVKYSLGAGLQYRF